MAWAISTRTIAAPLPGTHAPGKYADASKPRVSDALSKQPLRFEANQGQTDERVKFLLRGRGYTLFLTADEAVLSLIGSSQKSKDPAEREQKGKYEEGPLSLLRGPLQLTPDAGLLGFSIDHLASPGEWSRKSNVETPDSGLGTRHSSLITDVICMKLVGANPAPVITGMDELPGKSNYFIGNDPKKWRTNVPSYGKVVYKDVYPGIDLVYFGNEDKEARLEFDFIVSPGADPNAIKLAFEGTDKIRIDARGDLVLATSLGDLRIHKPAVYQFVEAAVGPASEHAGLKPGATTAGDAQSSITNRQFLEGGYILRAPKSPSLESQTPNSEYEVGFEIASYDPTKPLVIDPWVGTSTRGGTGADVGFAVAVDASGYAYVAGSTSSTDFPTTSAPYQSTYAGGASDIFVVKANLSSYYSSDNDLLRTYVGGSDADKATAIALDGVGNVYITGVTCSADFPVVTPYQVAFGGGTCPSGGDAFVAKLNSTGSSLLYSTFLGGSGDDMASGIALDSSNNIYLAGSTTSTNFPTASALQAANGGSADAFITKLAAGGASLSYSTYLGGSGSDQAAAIAADSAGNAYVTGFTASSNFPTASAYRDSLRGPADAFVAELNAAGSALVYSTFLGGSGTEAGSGIAVDSSGSAFVTGTSDSTNFPMHNAFQASNAGGADAFITKFNSSGSALVYSTYLGGGANDVANGITVPSSGAAMLTGYTTSSDFPVANSSSTYQGGRDVFVTKFSALGSPLIFSTYVYGGTSADETGNAIYGYDSGDDAFITGSWGPDALIASAESMRIPLVTFSPTSLSFPGQTVGTTSAPQAITLTNSGDGDLYISSITVSGDFAETHTCPIYEYPSGPTLAPLASCTIDVTFTPASWGTRTGTLTLTSTDVMEWSYETHTVSLTGTGTSGEVSLSTSSLTFPDQDVGTTSAPQPVTLTNSGSTTLFISSIAASGDYAQTNNCGTSQAPAATCTINVTFSPTAHGSRVGGVTITDSAPGSPHLISCSGTGLAPEVTLDPTTSLSFGNQRVDTTSTAKTVTLTNNGTSALTVSSISITGTNSADFAQTNNCPVSPSTLAPTANCTINVTFKPTSTGGKSAQVSVASDASGSPHTVALSGTGVAPEVTLSTTDLTFADQPVGTTSVAQTVTLTNSGTATLNISSIAITGTNAGDFAQDNNCGTSRAPEANCTISVTFTPTHTEKRTGDVSIASDATGSPHGISLTGTGVTAGPAVNLSPSTVAFGDQSVGTTSTARAVTLTNTGNLALSISNIEVTGDFARTHDCGTSVAVGEHCTISVTFHPTDLGPRDGLLSLTSNASGSPHAVTLTGNGVPAGPPIVALSPTSVSFGDQELGTASAARQVTLSNTGASTLNLSTITVTGDFAQTHDCGTDVAASASCTIKVTFTPTDTGTRNGQLTIASNASSSPDVVSLTGNGVPAGTPILHLSPTSLNFGSQTVGTTSTAQPVTLTNAGTVALNITSIMPIGDYAETHDCGASVAASGSCTISVTFEPASSGTKIGRLEIASNASGSPHSVALTGVGIDFSVAAAAGSPTEQTVAAGATATYNLALVPNGFVGTVALGCSGAPQATTCTISPTSVELDGASPANFTVSLKTTARSVAPPRLVMRKGPPPSSAPFSVYWLLGGLALISLAVLGRQSRQYRLPVLGIGVLFVVLLAACGFGGGDGGARLPSGTPAGTYTITITATANGVSRECDLKLTVT